MKKIILFIIVAALSIYEAVQQQTTGSHSNDFSKTKQSAQVKTGKVDKKNTLKAAFKNKRSDFQVQDSGIVIKSLPDDLKGSRHQKFILKNNTGQTVLIAHNIDLAPRINGLKKGDRVEFFGEYEWNPRGGVVHWTHHDPKKYHVSGWLKHNGRTYE